MIDGQKVWTSQALTAQWIFVLARTNPDAPKHRGLSFLLVPLDQPGDEIKMKFFCELTEEMGRGARDRLSHLSERFAEGDRCECFTQYHQVGLLPGRFAYEWLILSAVVTGAFAGSGPEMDRRQTHASGRRCRRLDKRHITPTHFGIGRPLQMERQDRQSCPAGCAKNIRHLGPALRISAASGDVFRFGHAD